jgi:antitoxin (DNA-binding transcriptional repressor) of toxin-antitoxin stability system
MQQSDMKTITVDQLREQVPQVLENLGPDGVTITSGGRDVARLVPVESRNAKWIGALKGRLQITGDIMSTGLKWDAES